MSKLSRKLAAIALAIGLLATSVAPAFASGGEAAATTTTTTTTTTEDKSKLTLKKEILLYDVDDTTYTDITIPEVTFSYTLAGSDSKVALDGDNTDGIPIHQGKLGTMAAAYTVAFDNASNTSGDVTTHKVATDKIELDFSKAGFDNAGVWRYKLSETGLTATGYGDSINKVKNDLLIDVYVNGDKDGNYKVVGYVVREITKSGTIQGEKDNDPWAITEQDITKAGTMSDPSFSVFKTYDVEISNTVTGLGNKQLPFDFNIDVTGINDNDTYKTTDTAITFNKDNTTATAQLMHGKKVTIKAVPLNKTISVSETAVDGYTTKVSVNGGTAVAGLSATGTDNGKDGVATVAFTNSIDNPTPAGVVLSIAPYVAMVVLAGLLGMIFFRKRQA